MSARRFANENGTSASRRSACRGFPRADGHIAVSAGQGDTRAIAKGNEIALRRRGITADTALRFARFFGTTPEVWLNLQSQYEIDTAKGSLWDKIKATIKPALAKTACL